MVLSEGSKKLSLLKIIIQPRFASLRSSIKRPTWYDTKYRVMTRTANDILVMGLAGALVGVMERCVELMFRV